MKNIAKRSVLASLREPLMDNVWSRALPGGAMTFAYLATFESALWLRALVFGHVAALLGMSYVRWSLNTSKRLGDALPPVEDGADFVVSETLAPSAREAAFEDCINASIARSNTFGRHSGLVSVWWAPGGDVDAPADVEPLRETLRAHLDDSCRICFVDDDRAWVLAPMLRSLEELQSLQDTLVQALLQQEDAPLRTVAAGCAIAPAHGYTAIELIEYADDNQSRQIRVHSFRTYLHEQTRHAQGQPVAKPGRTDRLAI